MTVPRGLRPQGVRHSAPCLPQDISEARQARETYTDPPRNGTGPGPCDISALTIKQGTTPHSPRYPRSPFAEVQETHTLAFAVDSEAGVLAGVIGLFSGRGSGLNRTRSPAGGPGSGSGDQAGAA